MNSQTGALRADVAYLPRPAARLTAEEIVQRAISLRPYLLEDQANTEIRGTYSDEMHQRFLDAGLYRVLQPKMYGGYTAPTDRR